MFLVRVARIYDISLLFVCVTQLLMCRIQARESGDNCENEVLQPPCTLEGKRASGGQFVTSLQGPISASDLIHPSAPVMSMARALSHVGGPF